MKLLFVVQEYGVRPSGVVNVVRELCKEWDKSDHITLLVNKGCQINAKHLDSNWTAANINVVQSVIPLGADYHIVSLFLKIVTRPLRWVLSISTLLYLIFWMFRENFDGVVSHSGGWPGGELNRLVIYAAWITGIHRRYLVIHNVPRKFPAFINNLFRIYSRSFERICTNVITVSNSCRETLMVDADFSSVEVIYNGLSFDKNNRKFLAHPPWLKQYITIGFVGEIHPRKGLHILIDALKNIDTLCEMVVIGSGFDSAYEDDIHKASESLQHPVHYLGFRDDVHEIYKWVDILVLPSVNYESFGLVIIEAMHNSIPVICSDFGGMKEVVSHENTGLVVKAGDPDLLSKALDKLLNDGDLRVEYGKAGKNRMELMFSSVNMLTKYNNLFHSK
jgi:glycosyltransferase involved in cell wall biosynthesis